MKIALVYEVNEKDEESFEAWVEVYANPYGRLEEVRFNPDGQE